ncbi:Uu.00g140360.m01.CDS01 [Anthostomella pinea]|uniref:Uu.00g140360.m01.CDS01 n=1 Tax=Anthostomella pinea TaxID=933095 RepID=A0AAI8VJM5_9PEZI|nr:Uu.00g140360.m01.CDS01 [Anthostomella pinea]
MILLRSIFSDTTPQERIAFGDEPASEQSMTVWDVLQRDERVSKFADIVGMFDDIVLGLSTPQAKFTVYAPVNEAFDDMFFPPDLPWFYWKFLAGYHMGPGSLSEADLKSQSTISSFVNADVFFTYKQRISVQERSLGRVGLNHAAIVLPTEQRDQASATNGFVHHIDSVLELPNSTARVIQQWPELSRFSEALSRTGLWLPTGDTNGHVGQTIFAPSNEAFSRLGAKSTSFLFSRGGIPYLTALLKFHIVQNHTLFSDVYFPHADQPLVNFAATGAATGSAGGGAAQAHLPTLHPGVDVTTTLRRQPHEKVSLCARLVGSPRGVETEEIAASVPDIVLMDGVIHVVNSLFLPTAMQEGDRGWHWLKTPWSRGVSVEQLMEILDPWVAW